MNILIIGASRGIGLEFARQYTQSGHRVIATVRSDEGLQKITALGAKALKLDVAKPESVSSLAWQLDGEKIDIAIYVAGIFGPRLAPLAPPTQDDFDAVMRANVLGAMQVIPQLVDVLALEAKLAVISSRMGSIGLRESAGASLYRASKAALNSVLKDTSLAMQGKAICVSFHPGWVRTEMGGEGADISVEESVRGMRQVMDQLQSKDNGSFINYDGQRLVW
ncbi:MAG: SDR family oxidoreductase [Brachymonas sp.]|nr:SDR family oxidoreductase [Brachymonas sp.]